MSAPRIVTLLPSATEIVCALGLEDQLVGRSHECDHPPAITDRPMLTSSRVALPVSSEQIDRNVRELLRDALAVYNVDAAQLEQLAPDLIVTQDLCDVCAVSFDDVVKATREMGGSEANIVSLRPTQLGDILDDVRRVGAAAGVAERAEQVVAEMQARWDAVAARSAALKTRPSVLTVEWVEPLMVGGTWMPKLVEIAGGTALCAEDGAPAVTLDDAALDAIAPEVVLVKPCGYSIERALQERELLERKLLHRDWPAVRDGRVYLADGNAYFNRSGPRLVDSAEILAACVHPEEFGDLAERHAAGFQRLELAAR